jgi:hypothetical protein
MKKIIKKFMPHIISFLIGVIGMSAVLSLPPLFGLQEGAVSIIIWLLILGIYFVLHIFIHEFGHLVAGKMSGYDFVSIRFFNVMFIKEDGKLLRKKFNVVGTLGQCLMSPPEPVNGKFPFVLYNLGGSLMNFIVSVLSLALFFVFSSSLFVVFAGIGIILGIINILPMNVGVPNDGHNAMSLGKNDAVRHSFWFILYANAQITKGMRIRDISEEKFGFLDSANLSDKNRNNALVVNAESFRFEWLIDRREFEKAKTFGEHLINTTENMIDLQKKEFSCELLFLELIGECRKEEIERLYTKDLQKYIRATSSYVSKQRLLYAYAKLFLRDDAQAAKALEKFNKIIPSYPLVGEIESNRELIEIVDKLAEERKEV